MLCGSVCSNEARLLGMLFLTGSFMLVELIGKDFIFVCCSSFSLFKNLKVLISTCILKGK
jgi:hypothetical protein